jgi:cell division protein FtsL
VQTLRRVPDARVLDRLLRGRAWIALIAVALLGIVFMQVSLLKLNAGISQAVAQSDLLERQNSQLRAAVSGLDAEARIQETAQLTGLKMPLAGDVRYLDARQVDPARAARSVTPPDRVRAATIRERLQGMAPATTTASGTSTSGTTGTATTTGTTDTAGATGTTGTTGATGTTGTTTGTRATTSSATSPTAPATTSSATTAPPATGAAATPSAAPAPAAPAPTGTTAPTTTSGAVGAPAGAR